MSAERKLSSAFAVAFIVMTDAIFLGNTKPNNLDALRSAFLELTARYTPPLTAITIVTDDKSSGDTASHLVSGLQVPVFRFQAGNPFIYPPYVKYNAVIFVLQNVSQVNNSLPLYTPFWNGETNFVIVASDATSHKTYQQKRDFFRMLWSRRIVKAVLLLTEGDLIEGHGFLPYTKNTCNDPVPLLVLKKEPDQPSWMHPDFHPQIRDLHGCELNLTYRVVLPYTIPVKRVPVQTEHIEGIEGRLMQTISEKFHFTPLYRENIKMEFAEFSDGLLGEVHFGISDIGFGLLFGFANRYDYFDVTRPHNVEECIGWVVPKGAGSTESKWSKLLLQEFEDTVWILTMCSFLLSFFYFAIPYLGPFDTKPNRAFFLNLYPSFLGLPLPLVDDCNFRGLALVWIWYSLIITTAYRSAMSSRLTAPNIPKNIENLKMLSLSHLRLFGVANAKHVVMMSAETELGNTHKTILSRFEVQEEFFQAPVLRRLVRNRDIAFMSFCNMFSYLSLQDDVTKGKVHIVEQCVYQYLPWLILRKASPLTTYFNRIVSSLAETGILLQWKKDYLPPVKAVLEESTRELTFGDVEAVFWLFLMGLALSVAVFLFEVVSYHKIAILSNLRRIISCFRRTK